MSHRCRPFKRKGAAGGYDTDSDVEPDIELNVIVSASGSSVTRTVHEPVQKRPRTSPLPQTTVQPEETLTAAELQKKPSRKQGASVLMDTFSQHFESLQEAILSTEHHPRLGQPCPCGEIPAKFRCTECFQSNLLCKECIVAAHQHHPFHFLGEWTGTFFRRVELSELDFVIRLGHYGGRCPNHPVSKPPRVTVIVHVNGVHRALIEYCYCKLVSDAEQLVRARLFPSTMKHPETAMTFAVLKHFHISNLTSKKSAYDYAKTFTSLTNNAFPQKVPDRYREFAAVARVWSHLALVRRTGQAHGIDAILSHRRRNSLTVRCPACIEVGFNIDPDILNAATVEEVHKYTLFLSTDGNFRLQRKNKNDDPDDTALNDGNAYFVPTEAYKEYLKHTNSVREEPPSCSHLQAGRLQNVVKFKNAVISGVVAFQCARHGFYMPQGTVDLVKGEEFRRTDFALMLVLVELWRLRWILISYDIWCQYVINLRNRFSKWFPAMVPILDKIRGAIPKMHVLNHVLLCMLAWSFTYKKYSGETCGENIEGGWAEQNQSAGSTKEMNDGHRHDALDDFMGHWNWTKLHQIAATLERMYKTCIKNLKTREGDFEQLTALHPEDRIAAWNEMDTEPKVVGNVITSVYEVQVKNGPPTLNTVYQSLVQDEVTAKLGIGEAALINVGLQLEHTQAMISAKLAGHDDDSLTSLRAKLNRDLSSWRQEQLAAFPDLSNELSVVDASTPEKAPLLLPSSFKPEKRVALRLDGLAVIEYKLREGQAHDALAELRLAIKTCNANLEFKKKYVHGQKPNTRAQQYLRTLEAEKKAAAEKYRRAYAALLSLGLSKDDKTLEPLLDNQLWMKNVTERHKLGSSRTQDPWFWLVGRPSGMSTEEANEWSIEMDRVKWFRDRAARDRAREEKEILEEEFRRSIASFRRMSEVWFELASKKPAPGYAAYCHKQAVMYSSLASDCEKKRDDAFNSPAMWYVLVSTGS
ncbi:hypothetical protein LshimejAT787_0601840 [Lyophyllum shimeji]|uniref:CxC2-like cysteine cluster KDZ transposase-associated domain-containing protein n=1 Tax=Lyophyllum shimeji TaxID=47721 RepID=A0A9P3PMF3_LYOSH|nr:hypothetical protein LshimejAT787_0601840 [Lyophyllum shimeji]